MIDKWNLIYSTISMGGSIDDLVAAYNKCADNMSNQANKREYNHCRRMANKLRRGNKNDQHTW